MQKLSFFLLALVCACLYPPMVFAAGAYVVDDGGIVDPGNVQIETWMNHSDKGQTLGIADLAYQLLPHAEVTLLNSYDTLSGTGDDASGQVKYQVIGEGDDMGMTMSPVLGFGRDMTHERFSSVYAYVPATFAINEWLDANLDLGWDYAPEEHVNFFTWGVSAKVHLAEKLSFVQEVFGKNDTNAPGLQSGLHYDFSETLQGDLIYGRDITGTPGNWVTVGATFTF